MDIRKEKTKLGKVIELRFGDTHVAIQRHKNCEYITINLTKYILHLKDKHEVQEMIDALKEIIED